MMTWLGRIATAVAVATSLAAAYAPAAHAGAGYFSVQDLSASSGAPHGYFYDRPTGWATPWDLSRHFAYQSSDGRIIVASTAAGIGTWTWVSASGQAGVPTNAAASPLAAFSYSYGPERGSRVLYVDASGHVRMLWTSPYTSGWQVTDLTAITGAPHAYLSVTGYEQDGVQHVIYQSASDQSVWELWWSPSVGYWMSNNLSAVTGTTAQRGTSVQLAGAGVASVGQVIAYANADGHLHLLVNSGGGWGDWPVAAWTGAPALYWNTGLNILASGRTGRFAVAYRGIGGDLHEMGFYYGVTDTDVSVATGPQPDGCLDLQPGEAFALDADTSDHIFVTDLCSRAVYEFVRTSSGAWVRWLDTYADAYDGAFAAPDTSTNSSYTEYLAYFQPNSDDLIVEDLTVAWQ